MEHKLTSPISRADILKLSAGDSILLSGTIYTARDAAHKRIIELLDRAEPLPFQLAGSTIYYSGPTPEPPGRLIGSAGPTTSGRMDAYAPQLLDLGQAVMIGKGNRSRELIDAIVRNRAVYLAAMGGAGALMSACVRSVKLVCWEDLGCEAVRELEVINMPLTVAIDSHGRNIYEFGPKAYLESLEGGK